MLSVEIHRDLTRYRAKVVGGLTARSLACTVAALAVGGATYGWLVWVLGLDFDHIAGFVYASTLPLWVLGFFEPAGMRPERWLPLWLRHHGRGARLTYDTYTRYRMLLSITELAQAIRRDASHVSSHAYARIARRHRGLERWEPGRT